ncbi:unnamed protein product [Chondrus crispus]|uniref:Spondin domain-containing protein n=1 Tax=Chondrus crispus TaxID=2769 RepID=R7QAQ2_CHOCR|nr:unnamed protein product [Chondrus crispus]CDF34530.1 unnamed protein product [Chondrus crispus]|eukprot:XP_005714349.1 unnamed protein product [Chondrus crispus]
MNKSTSMISAPILLVVLFCISFRADGACQGRQSYVLSIQTSFTRSTLPTVPDKARIPLVIAVAHSSSFNLFLKGDKLTDEVAEVAEKGRAELLATRLNALKESGVVSSFSVEEGVPIDEVTKLELTVEDEASLVSIIAPLSPSPAWFAGLSGHDLCNEGEFIPADSLELVNYNAGLQRGTAFGANVDPYPEGKTIAVGPEESLSDSVFARLSLEEGSLGVDWWKIFLGVLVAVAVAIVVTVFILPRCRRKKTTDIPLTAPDGVQW